MTLHIAKFIHLRAGKDKVSAKQYNRLVDIVMKMSQSLMTHGIMDSSGFCTRKQPQGTSTGAGSVRLGIAQEAAPGDIDLSVKFVMPDGTTAYGDAFDVACKTTGSANLNSTLPRIASGEFVFISKISGVWYCVGVPFQISENCACS